MWSLRCSSALLLVLASLGWLSASALARTQWLVPLVAGATLAAFVELAHRQTSSSPSRQGPRLHPWAVALILALGRMCLEGSPHDLREAGRGVGVEEAWQEVVVENAAWPGEVCSFRTRSPQLNIRMAPDWPSCDLGPGDRLRFARRDLRCDRAAYVPAVPQSRPTCDLERYLLRSRGDGPRSRIAHLIARIRTHARSRGRQSDASALVMAMTTGIGACLSPMRREELRRSGLSHLIAVSGLHVGAVTFAALTLALVLRRAFPLLGGAMMILSLMPAVAFVVLAGASPSALRALLLSAVMLVAAERGLPFHRLSSCVLVAAVMAAGDPTFLCAPSYQLSFAAVLGIVLGSNRAEVLPGELSAQDAPRGALGSLRSVLVDGWRISVRATLGTTPIVLWHFGQAPWIGLLSNLLAVPLTSGVVLPLGVIALPVELWLSEPLGAQLLRLAEVAADLVLAIAALASRLQAYGAIEWTCATAALCVLLRVLRYVDLCGARRHLGPLESLTCLVVVANGCVAAASLMDADSEAPPGARGAAVAWVLGGTLEPTLLAGIDPHSVCLHMRSGDPARVARLVRGLRLRRVVVPPTTDPRAHAIYRELSHVIELETRADCISPQLTLDESVVSEAYRACHYLDPRSSLLRITAQELHCHANGSWLPLRLDLAASSASARRRKS